MPVSVQTPKHRRRGGAAAVLILVLWAAAASSQDSTTGRLAGAWIPPSIGPVAGGLIYAFDVNAGPPPQRDRPLRSPDAFAVTDNEGRFMLDLPPGTYYLSTRKQARGNAPGPPQAGDLYGLIRDHNGELMKYTVLPGVTQGIGIIRQATVFKERPIRQPKDMTAIAGVVRAGDGTPVANAVVMVYRDPDFQKRPSYVSHKTGKDGKYVVKVEQEGTYFVTVRAVDGRGRPTTGDLYGVYGGDTPQPVTVVRERVTKGVDIRAATYVDIRPQ